MSKYCCICSWMLQFILLASASQCIEKSLKQKQEEAILQRLIGLKQRIFRPNSTGAPINVEMSIHFVRLEDIKTHEQSFTADMFIRMRWNDPRLCHNSTDYINIPGGDATSFWSPDFYFVNALKSNKHEVLKKNHYLRIYPDGKMFSSSRVTVVARCVEDLTYYPVDSQICQLLIESYSYTTKHVKMSWRKMSPITLESPELVQFVVRKIQESSRERNYETGTFLQLIIKIHLERRIGYYIAQIFLPCTLVVMLSWVTFWMNPDDIGDRTALTVTSVLTIALLISSINENLPKVSYIKAIDLYLIGCFVYVFTAVIETVVANSLCKKAKKHASSDIKTKTAARKWLKRLVSQRRTVAAYTVNDPDKVTVNNVVEIEENADSKTKRKPIFKNLDSYCKVLYPAVFVILSACYWGLSFHHKTTKLHNHK